MTTLYLILMFLGPYFTNPDCDAAYKRATAAAHYEYGRTHNRSAYQRAMRDAEASRAECERQHQPPPPPPPAIPSLTPEDVRRWWDSIMWG